VCLLPSFSLGGGSVVFLAFAQQRFGVAVGAQLLACGALEQVSGRFTVCPLLFTYVPLSVQLAFGCCAA
jgi:hypothetical protein